jgi:hypothetical protein
MLIIHAVQKLLNISRLKPSLYISQPSDEQEMHSWYAKLVSTSFRGKLIVLYVHEPSLLIVLTEGKTITGTFQQFCTRLEALLKRNDFEPAFIEKEMKLIREGYVISKTNNKSILSSMNAITENIEYRCYAFENYEKLDLNSLEDAFMQWHAFDPSKPGRLRCTSDYWRERGLIK